MELWLWILIGVIVLGLLAGLALAVLVFLAFTFISSGQLEKEDSDFR
jgi:hypothetical protein